MREVFEAPDAAVHFVATGTAANALSLACLCPPWATIYCHRGSHIEEDECCAPEFFTGGAKLTPLDGAHGKIAPETLSGALAGAVAAGVVDDSVADFWPPPQAAMAAASAQSAICRSALRGDPRNPR